MDFLNKYISIPYKEKGRDFDGVDCYGLNYLIYKNEIDLLIPSYADDYQSAEDGRELGLLINKEKVKWIKVDIPEIFDGVLIRMKGHPMHCGMYIGDGLFIHCLKGSGVTIEKIDSITWKNRILGFYRYDR